MIRTFARDALVYGAATVLTRATSLIVVPIYTRFLSPADYGVIDLLTIASNLMLLTVALEISQAVARFIPEAMRRTRWRSRPRRLCSPSAHTRHLASLVFSAAPDITWGLIGRRGGQRAHCSIGRGRDMPEWDLSADVWGIEVSATAVTVRDRQPQLVPHRNGLGVLLVAVAGAGIDGFFVGQIVGGAVGVGLTLAFSRGLYRPMFDTRRLRKCSAFQCRWCPQASASSYRCSSIVLRSASS